jgi:hypothetical protein
VPDQSSDKRGRTNVKISKIPTTIKAQKSVTVKVRDGQIVVNPDELHMGNVVGQEIEWTVVTPGWDFPLYANGIALKVNHHDFSNGHRAVKKKFRISNLNSVARRHRYTVTVIHSSGRSLQIDPSIVNR